MGTSPGSGIGMGIGDTSVPSNFFSSTGSNVSFVCDAMGGAVVVAETVAESAVLVLVLGGTFAALAFDCCCCCKSFPTSVTVAGDFTGSPVVALGGLLTLAFVPVLPPAGTCAVALPFPLSLALALAVPFAVLFALAFIWNLSGLGGARFFLAIDFALALTLRLDLTFMGTNLCWLGGDFGTAMGRDRVA